MAIELWPALGKTVLDHNGDTITTAGISLATLTEYYSDLVVAGSLVTFDPLDADDPTVAIPTGTITLAKLANGTPGNLISYAANGTPVAVATGTAAQVLTSNGAGLPPTFQAATGGSGITSRLSTDLAANPGTINGQVVCITGRSTVGDGAEGFAVWNSSSTATSDNATVWGSGTGRWIRVGTESVRNVKWYGAVGDGSADDTAAIQAAIDAAIGTVVSPYTTMGLIVLFPAGMYRITASLTWANVNGLHLKGSGKGASIIWYTGATNSSLDLISFDGINCCIENFTIRTSGHKVRSAITCTSGTAGGWISSSNTFSDIVLGGFSNDQFQYGMRIVQGSAGDNNNELHRFYRCSVTAYTDAAWYVDGGQAHGLWFESCQMNGNGATGNALRGIYCYYGSYIHWNGGSGGYHTEEDFFLKNFFQHSKITGWNSENSDRLARIGEGTSAPFPLEISNCRFNSDQVPADEEVIRIHTGGPTTIRCNAFNVTGPVSELVTFVNELRTDYIAHRADDTVHDVVGSSNTISGSACTDLATAITLLNELRTAYAGHRVDLGPHDAADNVNTVASSACTDYQTAVTLAVQLKAAYNSHRTYPTVHPANDATNVVTSTIGRRAYIRNDGYTNTQNITVEGNSFVGDVDYSTNYAQSVESGTTFFRRGAIKGQNPSLWRVLDGGNGYYESSPAMIIHRCFPNNTGLRGLSATNTTPNNLGGTLVFGDGESSKTVTFSSLTLVSDHNLAAAEPDGSYKIVYGLEIGAGSPTGRVIHFTGKSATGFTANIDVAPSAGQTVLVHWLIFRA